MKKTNNQKLIEDKRPKKNVFIILLIVSLFLFIFLIGLLFYFWIDFQDKNEVNRNLIGQLKYDIENSINEKFKKESFSKFSEYDNLTKICRCLNIFTAPRLLNPMFFLSQTRSGFLFKHE